MAMMLCLTVFSVLVYCSHWHQGAAIDDKKDIRLTGGSSETEGRVDIFVNGEWVTICDNQWETRGAAVACRQLGVGLFGVPVRGGAYGQASTLNRNQVNCTGSENALQECQRLGPRSCEKDAGVVCDPEMRLSGGLLPSEGIVEIVSKGDRRWIKIRDVSLLDQHTVTSICQELGLGSHGFLLSDDDQFSGDYSDIVIDNKPNDLPAVSCIGDFDQCEGESCSSNGVCIHQKSGPVCICNSGFTGSNCSTPAAAHVQPPMQQTNRRSMGIYVLLVLLGFVVACLVFAFGILYCKYRRGHPERRNDNNGPPVPYIIPMQQIRTTEGAYTTTISADENPPEEDMYASADEVPAKASDGADRPKGMQNQYNVEQPTEYDVCTTGEQPTKCDSGAIGKNTRNDYVSPYVNARCPPLPPLV